MTTTRDVGLIGDPVSGSASPAMHNAAFSSLGLDIRYLPVRVAAEELPSLFPQLADRYLGLNVTRPLKEVVVGFCDELSPVAAAARSVNTIVFRNGRAWGDSTDVRAFVPAMRTVTDRIVRRAVVLGTGGAARAVTVALMQEGARVHVAGRNATAGSRLASELGVTFGSLSAVGTASLLPRADLVVNATPLGGTSDPDACPVPESAVLPPTAVVFDLVYRPRSTKLLRRARRAGCETVEGLSLLVEQGALSFEIWTGKPAPRDVMWPAAADALGDDSSGRTGAVSTAGARGRA